MSTTDPAVTNADTPPAGPLDRRRVLIIVAALMTGMFLAALDQTIVSTALPTIVADLHGAAHLSWVVTAYLLASTASTPLWGKLGDQYGRKQFFQASIVIFLVGSVLSGISGSMLTLIAFRALQGLGGGGLMVGAQAIVGDVVSPRERGKYQGMFGAVFGVTTVIGPLLGGILTQDLSWRWVFYVNLPFGAVALVVTAAVLPGATSAVRHIIDYLGTALLAGSATALVLLTSLGGISFAWSSGPVYALGVIGALLLVAFVFVEQRAAEPVLPLRLFSNRTFWSSSAIGFVVGFAMFGAIVFLPLFLQDVRGVSATMSGLQLLPLMGGLLLTSILSGVLISRWGRYKVFPIVGTAVMTVGLGLLSTVGLGTSTVVLALYMFVLGAGLGAVMQVLVIAVQNSVHQSDLGVATSGATFFRSIGGSFGTAIFGAIFANVIGGRLSHYLHGISVPAGLNSTSVSPAVLDHLPAAVRHAYRAAFSSSLEVVFLVAVPVGALAFVLTFLLPELKLRAAGASPAASAAGAPEDAVASPVSPSRG